MILFVDPILSKGVFPGAMETSKSVFVALNSAYNLLRARRGRESRRLVVSRSPTDPRLVIRKSLLGGYFCRKFRMSYDTFKKNKRKDAEDSTTTMLIGIRFLAGASYLSLARLFNRSQEVVFRCIHRFVDVSAKHDTLGVVEWASDEEEAKKIADAFAEKSKRFFAGTSGLLSGSVGAIDGFVFVTNCPRQSETTKTMDYYSDH
jgi:hypothetical protein